MPSSRQYPWLVNLRFVVPALDPEARIILTLCLASEAGLSP
ncbi:MAG TPA: hypothetical protein VE956_17435 [Nodularia sp. (in: cyanobacteria)]|nr:hypothetical protein [Nodularia sp. (in: cyanobacteria)]